jgi:hypothetical protein
MVPTSNGHQRRLPTKPQKTIESRRPPTGANVRAGTLALVRSPLALRCSKSKRASHIDPPASSYAIMRRHAPTAERTMNPARMCLESLDRRPRIREQPGSIATETRCPNCVRSSFDSDHIADAEPRRKRGEGRHIGVQWQDGADRLCLSKERTNNLVRPGFV